MSSKYPCVWIKNHWDSCKIFIPHDLMTDNDEYIVAMVDGELEDITVVTRYIDNVSKSPCEWIRKYWNMYEVTPKDYACEFMKRNWKNYQMGLDVV